MHYCYYHAYGMYSNCCFFSAIILIFSIEEKLIHMIGMYMIESNNENYVIHVH